MEVFAALPQPNSTTTLPVTRGHHADAAQTWL
jgi:hypothetical protein